MIRKHTPKKLTITSPMEIDDDGGWVYLHDIAPHLRSVLERTYYWDEVDRLMRCEVCKEFKSVGCAEHCSARILRELVK